MGKYRGMDAEEGWIQRRFAAIERAVQEMAAARRLVIATTHVQVDINSVDLASSFTTYGTTSVDVPEGFTYAILHLFASAGTSFAAVGNGNVGVQPVAAGFGGSAISTGKTGGGAISVSSTFATKIAVPTSTFLVWASAYANGDPRVAGSGNVHISGSVLFVRS